MKTKVFVALAVVSLFLACSFLSTEDLPDKAIVVLSPSANEVVQVGGLYEIRWKIDSSDPEFGDLVTIEFSNNGGKSWQEVENNVGKSGKYSWKVPKTGAGQCKVRVFSQRRSEYRGTSGVFTVK